MISGKENHDNGSYKETIYFREKDDTYCSIPDTRIILINPLKISSFFELYDTYKNEYNIVIDSRLEWIIIYGILRYETNILIYNILSNTVINIFSWCRLKMSIMNCEINVSFTKKILLLYLFVNYYLKDCRIHWNSNDAINAIKQSGDNNNYITLDYIIIYINNNESSKLKIEMTDLSKSIASIFMFNNLSEIQSIGKYKISDIQNILRYLRSNNFTMFG